MQRPYTRLISLVFALLTAVVTIAPAHAVDKARIAVTLAQQASKSFETGDFARASELYLAAWRTDPNPDFLFGAARSAQLGGLADKAVEQYQQFLATEGADPERKKRATEYMNELERAKIQARVAEAERVQHDDPKVAAGLYLDTFKLAPKQFELLFKAAVAEQLANDLTSSERHLRAYLQQAPADAPDRNQAQARLDSLVRKSQPLPEKVPEKIPEKQPTVTPEIPPSDPIQAPIDAVPTVTTPVEPEKPRWVGWALVGGGAALAIVGLSLYAATTSDIAAYKSSTTTGTGGQITKISQEEAAKQASSINARVGTGWALAGVGAVAAGVGAWWLLTTPEKSGERTLFLTPGPTVAGMGLGLHF